MKRLTNWLKNLFKKNFEYSKPNSDYSKVDIDLLSSLFGTDEARKQLLNVKQQENVSPEQVLKDAKAMELMLNTYPWRILEQAIWRRLLTTLRYSLSADTLEKREAARNATLAHLSDLHLPYELKHEKERIEKMLELTKVAQEVI